MPNFSTISYHFYLIFPNIFGFKGGLQVYSTFLLQALQQLYPEADYDVFLKYDREIPQPHSFLAQTQFHVFGHFPRWLQNLYLSIKFLLLGLIHRPSLIIITHVNYGILGYVLSRFLGIPYWIVTHGDEVWNLQAGLAQLALKQAEKIVSVSEYTGKNIIQNQGVNPKKIKILSNTFDATQFYIKPKPLHLLKQYQLSAEQPIILTVSRLGKTAALGKGYRQVLQALVQVRQYIPNVHYLIVGKGDARSDIEALIQQLNLTNCVTLTGFIPDEFLCDYYNLCDVFALPSRIEGFGIVYLEALACGKPILAGNQDGSVEPILGGELGCLVNPENFDAIAKCLIKILQGNHENEILYCPERLRERVITNFDFSQFKRKLKGLIEDQFNLKK